MKARIGQRFKGHVQGYSAKVMFVTLDSPFVEVGVPLVALGGNFFVDERRTKATGYGALWCSPSAIPWKRKSQPWMRICAGSAPGSRRQGQDSHGKAFAFVPLLAAPATLREGIWKNPDVEGRLNAMPLRRVGLRKSPGACGEGSWDEWKDPRGQPQAT